MQSVHKKFRNRLFHVGYQSSGGQGYTSETTPPPPTSPFDCFFQDVQWNDIDYMDQHLDFTFDPVRFKELPALVDNLHDNGQHYVMITVGCIDIVAC